MAVEIAGGCLTGQSGRPERKAPHPFGNLVIRALVSPRQKHQRSEILGNVPIPLQGWLRREGRYSRSLVLLDPGTPDPGGVRAVPIIGRVAAGLPLYAQQEWAGSVLVDSTVFRGDNLFALRVQGDSMRDAGILEGDLAICEPRQFAANGEIVVALVHGEEATVKRFFYRGDHIELRPENDRHPVQTYGLGEVLIQGKVIGIQRGPEQMAAL